jgi:hypothetical protein
MGSIAVELEKLGIPTVTLYNERHETRFMGTVLAKGFADYPAKNFVEIDTLTEEGVLALAPQAFDFLVAGLTTWAPPYLEKQGDLWVPTESEFIFTGAAYAEALENMNEAFLADLRWGDGLPLVPATRERVDALLAGTDLAPDTVIGTWGPTGAQFTVEKIAINAAMAGAQPEYMPVILAALQAITSVRWDSYGPVMKSPVPLVIVNGPVAKQIGLNSSANAFGPNPKYPAGATIGRAISLAMHNIPGNGRGLLPSNLAGNPAMYAGMVIAEAEETEALAEGWDPLNVQLGYAPGTNTVTVLGVDQMDMSISGFVANVAAYVAPDKNIWPSSAEAFDQRVAGVVAVSEMMLITDGMMKGITKADIQEEMYEKARIPVDEFMTLVLTAEDGSAVEPNAFIRELIGGLAPGEGVPVAAAPDKFLVVATGGH